MNIILIVIIYALNANGTFSKTETHYPLLGVTYMPVCEALAKQVKVDKVLNTPSSYVFSAECERE